MPPRPVTDEERRQIRELHSLGLCRNDIAKRLKRSGETISRVAADMGLSFAREQVKAATEAMTVDARARRAALGLAFLEDAERLRLQLFEPSEIQGFDIKGNFRSARVSKPPPRDQKDIAAAASLLAERSMRLDHYDKATGAESERSMLLDLMGKLGEAWRGDQDET